MPSVGDLFDGLVVKVRDALLGGSFDKALLANKERATEDLCNSYSIPELEPIGDVEFEAIEVERVDRSWPGEEPIKTTGTALRLKQKIKPNEYADTLMSLPAGSSLNARGEVTHARGYLVLTVNGNDWSEEATAKQVQYGKNEIASQMTRRNEDIRMGNKRVLDKINEIISGRLPQLHEADNKKSQLEESLRKLKGQE